MTDIEEPVAVEEIGSEEVDGFDNDFEAGGEFGDDFDATGDEAEEYKNEEVNDIKLFGKWDVSEIEIRDISLQVSICHF